MPRAPKAVIPKPPPSIAPPLSPPSLADAIVVGYLTWFHLIGIYHNNEVCLCLFFEFANRRKFFCSFTQHGWHVLSVQNIPQNRGIYTHKYWVLCLWHQLLARPFRRYIINIKSFRLCLFHFRIRRRIHNLHHRRRSPRQWRLQQKQFLFHYRNGSWPYGSRCYRDCSTFMVSGLFQIAN